MVLGTKRTNIAKYELKDVKNIYKYLYPHCPPALKPCSHFNILRYYYDFFFKEKGSAPLITDSPLSSSTKLYFFIFSIFI